MAASAPDDIVPDDKDWTWVLERPCGECGLDAREIPPTQLSDLLREVTGSWRDVLTGDGPVTTRPRPDVWSPLEYGCHVRDAFRRYDERLRLMLNQVDPLFASWDQDRTALEDRYSEQHPGTVAQELSAASVSLTDRFDSVSGDQWHRTGNRDDGARFTVETLGRYFLHDVVHHLYDVTGAPAVPR
ncbi:MAG: DinB family protein [Actinomycetes bacterium]